MSVDTVQPTLGVPAIHPKQDANAKSGRDPGRDNKPGQGEKEQHDPPDAFMNTWGQLTGKTINITA
jgi:hypothetical protein